MTASSNLTRCLAASALSILLASCANSGSTDTTASSDPVVSSATATTTIIDYSCDNDGQCAIKDIGSCCGYRPACVNVDSPTDPAAVKADCARDGRAGICGFPAISSCQCVNHRCEDVTGLEHAGNSLGDK